MRASSYGDKLVERGCFGSLYASMLSPRLASVQGVFKRIALRNGFRQVTAGDHKTAIGFNRFVRAGLPGYPLFSLPPHRHSSESRNPGRRCRDGCRLATHHQAASLLKLLIKTRHPAQTPIPAPGHRLAVETKEQTRGQLKLRLRTQINTTAQLRLKSQTLRLTQKPNLRPVRIQIIPILPAQTQGQTPRADLPAGLHLQARLHHLHRAPPHRGRGPNPRFGISPDAVLLPVAEGVWPPLVWVWALLMVIVAAWTSTNVAASSRAGAQITLKSGERRANIVVGQRISFPLYAVVKNMEFHRTLWSWSSFFELFCL